MIFLLAHKRAYNPGGLKAAIWATISARHCCLVFQLKKEPLRLVTQIQSQREKLNSIKCSEKESQTQKTYLAGCLSHC